MKKIKLLLAAFAAMVSLGVQAVSDWVPTLNLQGEEVVAGKDYYMINVGTARYANGGECWGTQATASTTARTIRLEAVDADYYIRTLDNTKYLFRTNTDGWIGSGVKGCFYDGGGAGDNAKWTLSMINNTKKYYKLTVPEAVTANGGYVEGECLGVQTNHQTGYTSGATYGLWYDVTFEGNEANCTWAFITDLSALSVYNYALSAYLPIRNNVASLISATDVYTDANGAVAALETAISTQDAAVDVATSTGDIDNAITQLRNATNTFISAVTLNDGKRFDITNIYLTNADFEVPTANGQMPPGWTITIGGANCGQQNRTDTNPETGLAITNFIEAWHWSQITSGVIAQTVNSLPEGTYVLECDASICHDPAGADDITGANLFIQSSLKTERKAISNVRLYINHYSLEFSHGGVGSVTFGLEANNTNANWLSADNFKVYYAGGVDLSIYVDALADAVAEFEALEASSAAADYATYKEIVDENNTTWSNSSEYQAAIDAIHEATDELKAINQAKAEAAAALAAAKVEYNTLKAKVVALKSVEGYTETIDNATATLTAAIAATDAAVDAATDAETVLNQIDPLIAAAKTFIAGVRSDGAHPFDITFFITNPSFDNNNADGWTANPAPGFQSYTNCEYYQKEFDINQTLSDMPKGNYELKVQAFQRPGKWEDVYADYQNGINNVSSVIYINDGQTTIKNLVSEGATDVDHQWASGNDSNNGTVYYANSMNGAAQAFAAGYYWNTVLTAVEGTLKFGFKSTKSHVSYDWTIFDNFQLYYYGQSINVAMDEAEAFAALADIEGANVTMARNTKAGFNTVALPFDLTAEQVKDFFGDEAVVYAYSEESADANNATVEFNTKPVQTIEANVPVLVKATKAVDEITAENVTVKAGEAKAEGTNFDFVGNYAGQIALAEGDFFIGNDAVYKSEPSIKTTTIKGFRAYIKAKTTGGADVKALKLFIDGQDYTTAILGIDAAPAQNGAIYNIAGQRVSKAQKGIFIVNGKKVVK